MWWVKSRGKIYQRFDLVVSGRRDVVRSQGIVLNNIFQWLITIREEISDALICGILGYLGIFHNVILLCLFLFFLWFIRQSESIL